MRLLDCFKHILDKEDMTSNEEEIIEVMIRYSRLNEEKLVGVLVSEYEIPVTINIKEKYFDDIATLVGSNTVTSSVLFNTFNQLKRNRDPKTFELIKYYDDNICNTIGYMASGTWLKLVKI